MQSYYFHKVSLLLSAALLLSSCQTEPKKALALPPAGSQAPSLQEEAAPAQKSATPAAAPALPQKADGVEGLIAEAEKEYQAGRANYQAGRLEAAKINFNRAFDLLLRGQIPIRSDERLEREFEKIAEGVYQLELLAVKNGEGFTEPRAVEAPIDESNEVTFPVDQGVKAKAEEELKDTRSDLPLTLNDAVASYINYFSNSRSGRGFLEHGYIRSGRYHDQIVDTLKAEGVPQDLIFLAQAESGFHPLALSRAGARGMWQFMAGRGLQYGLARNGWLDERQDPVKSTRAAARHLKDLYGQFGDWYLAMAAYNSGPGTVQKAVERTGYADYWELYRRGVLPAETRNYVPIILAITIMSKNPAQYGLDRLRRESPLPFESVTLDSAIDLRLAADCAETSVAMLQELNPSLLRLATPKDQAFELRVPIGSKEKFVKAIAAVPPPNRLWWRYHRVEAGESLASIARKYRVTTAALVKANQLEDEEVKTDMRLVVPQAPGREGEAPAYSKAATHYKVRKGDTVASVASDFSVPADMVRRWNRLKGNALPPGRDLLIHRAAAGAPAGSSSESAEKGKSTRSGKTAGKQAAGKRSAPIAKAGTAAPSKTESGPRKTHGAAPSSGREGTSKAGDKQVVHRVKKGETLASIAGRYKVTVADLRKHNPKSASLRSGDILVIPQKRQ